MSSGRAERKKINPIQAPISPHRRMLPSCPAQKDDRRYKGGRSLLVWEYT
jgi:hypothetical protein